jgi:hypothetical protein
MPVKRDDKFAIIDELQSTRTKGSRLIISLLFAKKKAEAKEVRQKMKALDAVIDGLLAEAMRQWSGTGQAFLEDMKTSNRRLQRDIRSIQKKKEQANKVVNALGRLDDIILKAKEFLEKVL